ncbi:VaFE repeat-containing surface-anchored protein [Adlercreutzia sp. ZJ141]|uniref:VaFE repeat-containing surface-anchored protein n=1 Tax=Adlercreutzia sp. ZJ141 TaxID=2709406 RepID=UPI0013EC3EC2|nr:VaFE repeat-containing surface-anchored protein [Adlercreutzia sp. ZJ141]
MTMRTAKARRIKTACLTLALAVACGIGILYATTARPDVVAPDEAYAASTTFYCYQGGSGTNSGTMYRSTEGAVAFCTNQYKEGPLPESAGGSAFSETTSAACWDYLMYHGYPNTTTIGGKSWSALHASDITQIAAWLITDRSYHMIDYAGTDVLAAAERLADEALAYRGGGVEDGWSTLWKPADDKLQVLVTTASPGWIELAKTSADDTLTNGNACYRLEGARYGVYKDEACTTELCAMTTKADGTAASEKLGQGTYWVRETKAPAGYILDSTVYQVTVQAGKATRVNDGTVQDAPRYGSLDLLLLKHDGELPCDDAGNSPLGAASLAQARFAIDFYGGQYGSAQEAQASGAPLRSWTVQTDEQGRVLLDTPDATFETADGETLPYLVDGDDLFFANGKPALPLGTCVIREETAPSGYLPPVDDNVQITNITEVGDGQTDVTFAIPKIENQVKRGDLEFTKVRASTMERLVNVPFKLTSATTGEAHIIITDANGYASTAAAHTPRVDDTGTVVANGNDPFELDATYPLDDSCSVWFGTADDKQSTPTNERGALPYDVYSLEELPCPANEGLELVRIDNIAIARDSVTVQLGTVTDSWPEIGTTATDARDGDKVLAPESDVSIVDRVAYSGLIPGKEYTVRGTLMNADTGEPITTTRTEDSSAETELPDEPITAEASFTPTNPTGAIEVPFFLSTDELAGASVVVFEELYRDDRMVASHADLTNTDQTVTVEAPEEPTTPEEPQTPEKPTVPSTPASTLPATGDAAMRGASFALATALVMIGIIAATIAFARRRR